MGLGVWDVEWLNQNSQRRYPLFDDASATDTTGTFQIPNDFLVDMVWSAHSDASDPTLFHITSITTLPDTVILSVGYNGTTVATITIAVASHTRFKIYTAVGAAGGNYFDSLVKFTIGSLTNILAQPGGTWTFTAAAGRLSPSIIRPDIRGVSGLVLVSGVDGAPLSDVLQNEIELAAGSNLVLTMSTVGSRKRIRIDAIEGEGFNEPCECGGAEIAAPIRRINGIPPDSGGNFVFQNGACIDITAITSGLQLRDLCCQPCCGCEELKVLSDALQTLQNRIAGLEVSASALETVVDQMLNVILVSKLGTPGPCP